MTNIPQDIIESREALLPCPFCGSENINLHEGSSFRWVYMGCDDCGAQTGEYRFHTLVEQEQAKIEALQDGKKEWNTRGTPTAPVATQSQEVMKFGEKLMSNERGEIFGLDTGRVVAKFSRASDGYKFATICNSQLFTITPDTQAKDGE